MATLILHKAKDNAYGVMAVLAGVTLCIAAALKYSEARANGVTTGNLLLIFGQLLFALWFFLGIYTATTRLLGIALFAVLFNVTTYKFATQSPTCGCFGSVQTAPWVAMLIDAIFVCGFFLSRPRTSEPTTTTGGSESASAAGRFPLVRVRALLCTILAAFIAIFTVNGNSRTANDKSEPEKLASVLKQLREKYLASQKASTRWTSATPTSGQARIQATARSAK